MRIFIILLLLNFYSFGYTANVDDLRDRKERFCGFNLTLHNKNLGPVVDASGALFACLKVQQRVSNILAVGNNCFAMGNYLSSGSSQYFVKKMLLKVVIITDDGETEQFKEIFSMPYVFNSVQFQFETKEWKFGKASLNVFLCTDEYGHTTHGGNVMVPRGKLACIALLKGIECSSPKDRMDLLLDFDHEHQSGKDKLKLSVCDSFKPEGTVKEDLLNNLNWILTRNSNVRGPGIDCDGGLRKGPGYVFVPKL